MATIPHLLEHGVSTESMQRYISFQPCPTARMRLFCFPNAGSGVSVLHNWMRGLPAQLQVCAIQLPGRESRRSETPFRRMMPLVNDLTSALEPYLHSLPFAFFGHSFGALLAFELTRELRRRHWPVPVHLLSSSRAAPQLPVTMPRLSGLPEPEFIAEIQNRYNAIPEPILSDRDLMSMYLPVLRADLEILETYAYLAEKPLDCSISVFGGLEDPTVNRSQLEAWSSQTSGSFSLRMFPGDHFYPRAVRQPFVSTISEVLSAFY